MSEKKIVVPEGMLEAANAVTTQWRNEVTGITVVERPNPDEVSGILEAALLWLMENPIVPTVEQNNELLRFWIDRSDNAQRDHQGRIMYPVMIAVEWQRRMFLAPEPAMIGAETLEHFCSRFQTIGEAVSEAFRIGQDSGEAKALKNGVTASK